METDRNKLIEEALDDLRKREKNGEFENFSLREHIHTCLLTAAVLAEADDSKARAFIKRMGALILYLDKFQQPAG